MQEQRNKKSDNKENKSSKVLWVVIGILIIIIILLLLRSCDKGDTETYVGTGGIIPGEIDLMTAEEIQNKVNETVAKGMFQVFMNTKVKVYEDSYMDLMIQNNQNNHYDCYVTIYKEDELIYKSGIISPGYKLEIDSLQTELEDGIHDCIAYFCVLDEEGKDLNRIGLEITITKGEE